MKQWIEDNKYLAIGAGLALLVILSGVLEKATASEYPEPMARTNQGWLFALPNGEQHFCGRDGAGSVRCVDQSNNTYQCAFQEPPVYFSDCEIVKE